MSGAKSSTATATTATAESRSCGRFAPSPTGPLHLGSLVAAVGSYLDARRASSLWRLRLEDLDGARCVPGAEALILRTLAAFGFHADGATVRQSDRRSLYETAIGQLARRGVTFNCRCSRSDIVAAGLGQESRCVGDCRTRQLGAQDCATRVALDNMTATRVADRSGRAIHFDPAVHTDIVVRRRDGVIAYALAVVVDDAEQGITDVVRGGDLLPGTAWQLGLQQALSLPTPQYLHLPVVVEPGGSKLAKSRRALPLDVAAAPALLRQALALLNQQPSVLPPTATVEAILEWAIEHWDPAAATLEAEVCA